MGPLASVFAHRPVVSKKLLRFADSSNAMSSVEGQCQPARAISPLKMNQLVKCVLIRVIDEQNSARHVVQSQIASVAPRDVADSNGEHRLNREIIIRDFVRMTDKDVVIPHTSHG